MLISFLSRAGRATVLLALASCGQPAPEPQAASSQSALSAVPSVQDSVRRLTAKGDDTVEHLAGPNPGSTMTVIHDGHSEVLLAHKHADGTQSTRCVGSSDEADQFLNTAPVLKAAEQ